MQIQGLFWPVDPPKSSIKTEPPEPVWLAPDYLPGLAEARAFTVPLMTRGELSAMRDRRERLICDIEISPNYLLIAFCSYETGRVFYYETGSAFGYESQDCLLSEDRETLAWILSNFEIITFNGIGFDMPLIALALAGRSCGELHHAAGMIIGQGIPHWQVLKSFKVDPLEVNHVDLIEVCPLRASLKIYGGRIHVPRMRDLPFPPDAELSQDQVYIVRHYCTNDLATTAFLHANLTEQLQIRRDMSAKYGVDLRSKSDAQIAEAVIKSEIERLSGFPPKRPEIPAGTVYFYQVPPFLKFRTPELQSVLKRVREARFTVGESGAILLPPELGGGEMNDASGEAESGKGFFTNVAGKSYRMGIGGLHSCETSISHVAQAGFKIVDRDVASYYPAIILNQNLYPSHLGQAFIQVYSQIVARRLEAKRTKNKAEADTLKIVINGSFGKFGSKWSALYSPDLLIQVTISGQLALLMLIESLELFGVSVLSANTDGIVLKYPEAMEDECLSVVRQWEELTRFETEATEYRSIHCRDVNNYVAVKRDGTTKGKGNFAVAEGIFRFHKNPTNEICRLAVHAFLAAGVPVSDTIHACRDFRKFLTVRKVTGGACKEGEYLGKAIRWYYSSTAGGCIVYAASGNKVPKSDGARPCLELPDSFPPDVDFPRYVAESVEMLRELGISSF